MSDRLPDTELQARFRAQRHADAQGAPPFAALLARARAAGADAPLPTTHRLTLRRVMYVSGLAAAAAIGALLMIPAPRSPEAAFEQAVRTFQTDPALGAWRSPTAGLLDVPGSQLISTVPSVGTQ